MQIPTLLKRLSPDAPEVISGQEKLRAPDVRQTQPVPELVTPEFRKPTKPIEVPGIDVGTQPTTEDFIREAQKLGEARAQAAADIQARNIPKLAEELSRRLISQNVGAASGAGQQLQERAIGQFQERLEPVVKQVGLETAVRELELRRQEREEGRAEAREVRRLERSDRESQLDRIMSGQVDPSQMAGEDWEALGITDPQAVRTLAEVDIRNAMIADGYDPNSPIDQRQYRQNLRDSRKTQIREQIISNFAQVNDGQIPSPDEIEMMMYVFSGETGLLSPEEETALINKFNEEQWTRTITKARAMAPPEGKLLCTELYEQNKLPRDVYFSDMILGEYYSRFHPDVVAGYHWFAKPLVKKMRKYKFITALAEPFIKAWAYQMHGKLENKKQNRLGKILIAIGIPFCRAIGKIKTKRLARKIKRGEYTCQQV
jgi:hypothetical protein